MNTRYSAGIAMLMAAMSGSLHAQVQYTDVSRSYQWGLEVTTNSGFLDDYFDQPGPPSGPWIVTDGSTLTQDDAQSDGDVQHYSNIAPGILRANSIVQTNAQTNAGDSTAYASASTDVHVAFTVTAETPVWVRNYGPFDIETTHFFNLTEGSPVYDFSGTTFAGSLPPGDYDIRIGTWSSSYAEGVNGSESESLDTNLTVFMHEPGCVTGLAIASFGTTQDMITVGSAELRPDGNLLRLTETTEGQAGAAWYKDKVNVAGGFDTTFAFRISDGVADGIAFVIQDESPIALGGGGSNLGYTPGFYNGNFEGGISRSVAVEFDTFGGPPGEFTSPHVSVQTKGTLPNDWVDSASLAHAVTSDFADGNIHTARVVYVPGNIKVYIDDVLYIDAALDLENINGESILDPNGCAFLGFTGATGGALARQDILAWTVNNACREGLDLAQFNSTDVTVNGNASVTGANVLELTPNAGGQSGSAWYPEKVHVGDGFDTTFGFQIDGGTADGMAFVIQSEGTTALGGGGSDMGYGGIGHSLAVEIDTFGFSNEFPTPHISVQTQGAGANTSDDTASLAHATISAAADGQPHTMRVRYEPGTLHVWVDGTLVLTASVDLQDIAGNSILDEDGCAYVGFTAATGGATAQQMILNWTMGQPGCSTASCDRTIVAWRSVRTHTGSGPLGITLNPTATGNGTSGPTSETRTGGIQRIEIDFDAPVAIADPSKVETLGRITTAGVMGAESAYVHAGVESVDADTIAVIFTGLPNEGCYHLTLQPALLLETVTGDVDVRVRGLVGDTNSNGAVNLGDSLATKARINSAVTAFPNHDTNRTGGIINLGDALAVKAQILPTARQALCP